MRRTPYVFASLAALAAPLACSGDSEVERLAPLVELVRAVRFDIEDRIASTGELRAVEEASIAAEVSGRISEILRDEGQAVVADDVLLRIDPERRQLALASARAQQAEAAAATKEARR